MSSEPQQKYSFESYLASERAKEFRNEFVDGQVGVDRVHFVAVGGL